MASGFLIINKVNSLIEFIHLFFQKLNIANLVEWIYGFSSIADKHSQMVKEGQGDMVLKLNRYYLKIVIQSLNYFVNVAQSGAFSFLPHPDFFIFVVC